MDGVITDTAEAHAAAWKRMFDEALARLDEDQPPFDPVLEYRLHVDGKPRYQGCADFLASRGLDIPWGSADDPPDALTVCGLGNRKNLYFNDWLQEHSARAFPGTLRLLEDLRAGGVRCGVFTSSRNGRRVLDSAGVTGLFDAIVDGTDAHERGLAGKPAPDVPAACAEAMAVAPRDAALVEDATVGVEAGRRAGFALVIGIDRSRDDADRFLDAGADVVVADCAVLRLSAPHSADRRLSVATVNTLPVIGDTDEVLRDHLKERTPALFLDYDGTLTPIVDDPDAAVLSEAMREAIRRLADLCPVTVISGRDLADVRTRVGLDRPFYAGSHGFEVAGPEDFHERLGQGDRFVADLDAVEDGLRGRLADLTGVSLERKAFSVAIHVRKADAETATRAESLVRAALEEHPSLALGHGKKVLQIQPRTDWDKGHAVDWLLRRLGLDRPDVLPVYFGDDITDEDAFETIAGRGLGIVVRGENDRPTAATLAVRDTEGLPRVLNQLADGLGQT